MTANVNPIFALIPVCGFANISTGFTGRTTTGVTSLTIIGAAAGSDGQKIDVIRVQATGTTTAGVVRIWYYTGSGNAQLVRELLVTAITPSTTVEAYSIEWYPDGGIAIPSGAALYASTHNSEAFNVFARGGSYS